MKNPVEKRFEDLVRKWAKAIDKPKVKIVRFYADHDEENFISDLFEYMLAIDTDQEDLVFLLETPWSTLSDFSEELLEELHEIIEIWNTADRPKSLSNEKIKWRPDYTFKNAKNNALLFIKNINVLANELVPDHDIKISFILKIPYAHKNVNEWLANAIECGIEKHVRIGIADTDTNTIYTKLQKKYPSEVYTILPNLDMDGCVEEMAAFGDPQAPDTKYRKHLVKLMNSVKNKDKTAVKTDSKKCLEIAVKNVKNNVNWINQVVFIYTLLYTYEMSNKDYDKALFFADKAVESATMSIGKVEGATAYRLYGQTLLGRGTIYHMMKHNNYASEDYEIAIECYKKCNDFIMQCESTRLYAIEAEESGENSNKILKRLVEGFYLVDEMSPEHITNSTYPWLIKKLYSWNGRKKELSESEMKKKLSPYFGSDFMSVIDQYGKSSHYDELRNKS